jgi:choice-of-anchor B domain-containing protein
MRRLPAVILLCPVVVATVAGSPAAVGASTMEVRPAAPQSSIPASGPSTVEIQPAAARGAPPSIQAAATCVGGLAAGFPCRNIDLLSELPLSAMGGGSGSGGWGWTDPQTGKEYAIAGRSTGTSFVDISNPTAPVYLGNLPTATGTSSWRELNVYNNTAYIVSDNNGAHGLQVFDLTRLRTVTNPPVTFSATARNTSFSNAHTISINYDTGFAFVNGSNTCSGGPRMFNLATPTNPTFAGCVSADGYTHDAQIVVYHGPDTRFQGREILFASNEDTLTIFDVTSKSSPTQLARVTYSGRGYTHQGWLTEDHRFFLLDDETDETNFGHNTRTRVFSTSNLTSPTLLGFFTGPTTATDHNQFVKGNFSFQSNYRAGLRILDLTNVASPSSMSEAAFFDVEPASNAAGFAGTWTNYPYYPSGVVAIFSIQRGLIVVRPNLNAPAPTRVFFDNFETATGWTTNPGGTDTAVTGLWERGDPETTSSSGTKQLGTTISGTNDLVTGRLAGATAGENDIDGGVTSIRSPAITLPSAGTLTLSLSWYLAHGSNSSSADFFRVSIVHSGGTSTVFSQAGAAVNRDGAWATATANLTAFAGQSIRILIEAADASTASLVEAGVDDVEITSS